MLKLAFPLLVGVFAFAYCSPSPASMRHIPGLDTAKFNQGTAYPDQFTMLRVMTGNRHSKGYYEAVGGLPGVLPNGEVFLDVLRASPLYGDTTIIVYKTIDSANFSLDVDTFFMNFGPKNRPMPGKTDR